MTHTKESLLTLFKSLEVTTRRQFRDRSGLPDSVWERHFGNWSSFATSAGLNDSFSNRKLKSQIARHERHTEKLKQVNSDKNNWSGNYIKDSARTI